ncbi:Hypothetical_protein [Hexamita inflata]|uniref:Hypothetical_protein n=1 Tax=Hexamita inflata TaxID=28002 RepID=A0AA86NZ06_9EUKA|nr:Hypothetical protein HINF_LOCUS16279 [Hexamita inflata]
MQKRQQIGAAEQTNTSRVHRKNYLPQSWRPIFQAGSFRLHVQSYEQPDDISIFKLTGKVVLHTWLSRGILRLYELIIILESLFMIALLYNMSSVSDKSSTTNPDIIVERETE